MRLSLLVACATGLSASLLSAATIIVDFGDPAQQSTGNVNNIVSNSDGGSTLFNTVDTTGSLTGISMTLVDPFYPGSNQNGTTAPTGDAAAYFGAQATRDNLFGSTVVFGGFTEPTGGYKIAGLDATGATTYQFTFFGSRTGVTDIRETAYSLAGLNAKTVLLNTSNNTSNVVTATGLIPTAAGEITLTVGPGPNNNNASGFYYIGAMSMTSVVPEPASLALAAGTLALAARRRR